ncbi:unnamed protein product [Cylicostephanus goldi]|uniref:Uncharacterized protein n=1 Tax=Cylicostephanus goldi TaxID=71465 RepID=A0A3P7NKC0_CYLGO|nr:unnamed protein product [Cylicostephanus goldi]
MEYLPDCRGSEEVAYIEEIVNLTWHVDPPSFPIGSNEEIKLNDMTITKTRYEKCAGPYPMFRGSGKHLHNRYHFKSSLLLNHN